MKLANILLATDLSEHCGIAAAWTQNLKELLASPPQVVVEHTIELSVQSWLKSAFEQLEDPELRAEAEEKVAVWYDTHAGARPDRVVLRAGNALEQIGELVEELGESTLLVVSMTGKGAVKRFVVGSTSYALASQPPCPIAVVHPEHTRIHTTAPIVAATDLSHNGDAVVGHAADLSRLLKVPLEIVYAYGAPTSPLLTLDSPDSHDVVQKKVERTLQAHPGLKGLDYKVHVLFEEPSEAVVSHAERIEADIVVLGHSGETRFAQSVLGSVSQRVLTHMPCSLIIIPPVAVEETQGA